MFLGSIPPELRSMVHEHAATWPQGPVYVGCSGNFTIERVLHTRELHSNDVSLYSSAIGWWLAGQPVPITLKDESEEALGWLRPYLDTPIDTVATVMLATNFFAAIGRDGLWFHRLVESYRSQFPALHNKTVTKLAKVTARVASYSCIDVGDYLDGVVPADGIVCSFPPFDVGGYETMFKALDQHLDWPAPTYEVLDEDGLNAVIAKVVDRPTWMIARNFADETLADRLVGIVQPTSRSRTMYVYASSAGSRISRPKQLLAPVKNPRLASGEKIGDRLALAPLSVGEFNALRSQYLNPKIAPASVLLPAAVLCDGKIIGCIAFGAPRFNPTEAYLMSDFAVAPTDYPRLSKLVAAAALSREAQLLVQRSLSRRITHVGTTAFSNNAVSMKYRAVFELVKRADSPDPAFANMLNYRAEAGRWDLATALATWKTKFAKESSED